MYRYTIHYVKGDAGELRPPAVGYSLLSVVSMDPSTLAAIWQQDGAVEAEWGGEVWRYADSPVIAEPE